MTVIMTSGDLFESEAQTLVNATNTEGIMGGGIALAFKQRYPMMYNSYSKACRNGKHTIYTPHLYRYPDVGPWILNVATKDLVRNDSTNTAIVWGLRWIIQNYKTEGITSLAVPALGCGLGGLEWQYVKPLMEAYLSKIDIPVWIYEPQ